MKKINFLLSIIFIGLGFLFLIQSCTRDFNIDETVDRRDTMSISISEAKSIAENIDYSVLINNPADNTLLKSTNKTVSKQVQDSLTISDRQNKKIPYLYIFNYKSGGFVIISANRRTYPILAFSDSGKFDLNLNNLPFGVAQWVDKSAFNIREKITNKTKASSIVEQQWTTLLNRSNSSSSEVLLLKNEPITPPQNSYIYTVGPLTNTTWSQECDYNTYCPTLSGGPCGHAYTGCVTTAIAQVMAYWKRPTSYNWSGMSLTSGNDPVAQLMGDIFPNVIDSYNVNDGSGCSNDTKIVNTFKKFGYSSAEIAGWVNLLNTGGFDDNKIIQNIESKQPVIVGGYQSAYTILGIPIAGSGHSWVVDGYKDSYIAGDGGVGGWNYFYYHINWGWGGTYNGWFSIDTWSTPKGNYDCYNDMIYDIYP